MVHDFNLHADIISTGEDNYLITEVQLWLVVIKPL